MKRGFIDKLLHRRDGKDLVRHKIETLKCPQPMIETKIEMR
jgi:hypothetical protein